MDIIKKIQQLAKNADGAEYKRPLKYMKKAPYRKL